MVPQLRLRRARADGVPARADEREARCADRPAGPEGRRDRVGDLSRKFKETGRFGHSASIQATSRLLHDVVGPDGTVYPKGTAIPQRADFNTLDNPFAFSSDHARDSFKTDPIAGVHFVVFNPSGDDFERNRLAMDGVLPDGTKLDVGPRSRASGLQLRAHDDPPPELSRAASPAPLVPARRAVQNGCARQARRVSRRRPAPPRTTRAERS